MAGVVVVLALVVVLFLVVVPQLVLVPDPTRMVSLALAHATALAVRLLPG